MSSWFRRQYGYKQIPVSTNDTFAPANLRTDHTQEPNILGTPDDKNAKTNTKIALPQEKITPSTKKIYSVGILESRSTNVVLLSNMYKDTSPHLQKTREEIARRPLEKIESKRPTTRKQTAPTMNPRMIASVMEEENQGKRKPWRGDLTLMTWSPVIL